MTVALTVAEHLQQIIHLRAELMRGVASAGLQANDMQMRVFREAIKEGLLSEDEQRSVNALFNAVATAQVDALNLFTEYASALSEIENRVLDRESKRNVFDYRSLLPAESQLSDAN